MTWLAKELLHTVTWIAVRVHFLNDLVHYWPDFIQWHTLHIMLIEGTLLCFLHGVEEVLALPLLESHKCGLFHVADLQLLLVVVTLINFQVQFSDGLQ